MLKKLLLCVCVIILTAIPTLADDAAGKVTAFLQKGEINLALKEARRLVKKHPSNYQYLYQLMTLEHSQQEYDKVVDLCIKLDKIKPKKTDLKPAKALEEQPVYAYRENLEETDDSVGLRYIPNAPSYYQHIYYSRKTNGLIQTNLRTFDKLYRNNRSIKLSILQPTTLQQAKNLSYHHLVLVYYSTSGKYKTPKSAILHKNLRSISAVDYLIEYHDTSSKGFGIVDALHLDSPLSNTADKKLSTLLLAKAKILDKKLLLLAIELTAKKLPLENMRMRVQLKIKEGQPDDIFALLENSKLTHKEQAILLLEQAGSLPEKKLTTAILNYHKLIKNKQSLSRRKLENKWIEMNRSTEAEDILTDIRFLLREGNITPFNEQYSARFRDYHRERDWLVILLPTLPDSLFRYLSSRNIEDLRKLPLHFNKIKSAPVRVAILMQIGDHEKVEALLKKEIQQSPNSLDLRFLALSNILSNRQNNKDTPIKILPHLEAIYTHELSKPLRDTIDELTVEQLRNIDSSTKLKKQFKPKPYLQEVVRRSEKAKVFRRSPRFYEMMDMESEYLKLKEELEREEERLNAIRANKNRNITREFIENLKKGDQALALETAARDLKNALLTKSEYDATKLYREAKKKELHKKLTRLITPKNTESICQWIRFHRFMEKCGDTKSAKLAVSELQQKKSIPLQYRMQVAMILMPDFTEQALKILKNLPHDALIYLPGEFSLSFEKKSLTGQRRLHTLRGFLAYLEYFYENKSELLNRISFASQFDTIIRFTEPGVPSYLSTDDKIPATPYSQSRDKVINAIAKELMHYPHIADRIFETYIRKNNPPDEEIMELCAMILRQQTKQLEAERYSDQLSTQTYPRVLKTCYDYTVHYLSSQPEKAKQHFGNELIHFLKTKKQDHKDYRHIPFLLYLAKEKDPKQLTKIIVRCFKEGESKELVFLSHYNPLILQEYTRQYFSYIDQFIQSVETEVAEAKEKKPTNKRIDPKILYSLSYASPIVSSYLSLNNQMEQWDHCILRLLKADPLTTHPLTDFSRDKIKNDILPLLKLKFRNQSARQNLLLLDLSKNYPGLLQLVRLERSMPPQQMINHLKELKLLTKAADIDFKLLSPAQQGLWTKYYALLNISEYRARFAKRSIYLHLTHHYKYDLKSNIKELSKFPELATSLFCFKACTLSESPKELLDYLQQNTHLYQQLSKQQKADFITLLGLDNKHSSLLMKRPELATKLGISPTQITQQLINNAKQFLTIKSLDDPDDLVIAARDEHLTKNLAHIDPVLAAKVTLKQIDLHCQSKHAIKQYPDVNLRLRRAHENYTPHQGTPQNFIQSVIYQVELMTHPSSQFFGPYYKIKNVELRENINHIHNGQGKDTQPKDHIPYLKKLIKEFDQIPGKQRQENLRLCLIYSFSIESFLCELLPPILHELKKSDPAFVSQHQELIEFIEQACQYTKYVSKSKIPTQPFQINHLRTKPPLIPDTSYYLGSPTPLKLLSQLSNKDLHLNLLNSIYLEKHRRSKLFIPYSIALIERLENPTHLLNYDDFLKHLTLEHQHKPCQELVLLTRKILPHIEYLKSYGVGKSRSYKYLAYIATNGESTSANTAFLKLLLEKTPALKDYLYYQLKSIQYDIPVSHPIQFSEYDPDRFLLDFKYTRKFEKVFSKIDTSTLTKKQLFHFYRATAYLNDAPSEMHLIKSDQQARMKRLVAIIHKKYISRNYTVFRDTIKHISHHASIDTARALLPYLKDIHGKNKPFDKATFHSDHRYSASLHYALAIYDLKLNELNQSIDSLFPAKPHYSVYGDYTKALVDGAIIATLECIHSKDHQRLKKLLPSLRKILNLELRRWKPERTQSNLMNLNHYCHPHIMKTVELAHLLCDQSAELDKLKATFITDYEKKAWRLSQQHSINYKQPYHNRGNYYLDHSTIVYQAFLTHLPSAFGKDNPYYRNWHLKNQSYFSPKQMVDIVTRLYKTTPENACQKHLTLAYLHEIIGHKAEALEQWNKVISIAEATRQEHAIEYKLARIEALYHLEDAPTALNALEKVHPVNLAHIEKHNALRLALQRESSKSSFPTQHKEIE